jgi:hypothetical protein
LKELMKADMKENLREWKKVNLEVLKMELMREYKMEN